MGFDNSVVVGGHVQWDLLTPGEQADLTANYPHGTLNAAQFEARLDTAYILRHALDSIADDPFI